MSGNYKAIHRHPELICASVEEGASPGTVMSEGRTYVYRIEDIRIGRRGRFASRQRSTVLILVAVVLYAAAIVISASRIGGNYSFIYGNYQFLPLGVVMAASTFLAYGLFSRLNGRVVVPILAGAAISILSAVYYLFLTSATRSFPPPDFANPVPGLLGLVFLAGFEFTMLIAFWKVYLIFRLKGLMTNL